ncbi:NUDIX domain-containing protein [Kiloniella sp. b19]|uniref:NUDIX domain-containing protein n=1 Tax=Kiloniella sp. GXU_MW_B19 TaxID=3141326 RepID=UPI0031E10235
MTSTTFEKTETTRSETDSTGGSQTVFEVRKDTVFQGYFRVDKYHLRHSLFAGGVSPVFTREIFERGHAAAVIPFCPETGRVLLIEQFRAGAYSAGMPCWQIEIVAGVIETSEQADELCRREAIEEAGCTLGRLESIGKYLMTPGGSSETVSIFCGEVSSHQEAESYGVEEENEDIRAFWLPVEDAFNWVKSNKISNAVTVIALQWLQLNLDSLTTTWSDATHVSAE